MIPNAFHWDIYFCAHTMLLPHRYLLLMRFSPD